MFVFEMKGSFLCKLEIRQHLKREDHRDVVFRVRGSTVKMRVYNNLIKYTKIVLIKVFQLKLINHLAHTYKLGFYVHFHSIQGDQAWYILKNVQL